MLAIFRDSTVRTITDTKGVVWFSAYDVAQAVGYANAEKAVTDHCDERVKLTDIEVSIGKAELADMFSNRWGIVNMITEPMIYKMLMKGRAPLAAAFVDWIAHDLLPTLRKHGEYTKADIQLAHSAMAQVEAGNGGTDFATEIASLKASLALAQQEAQAQAQIAHDAQRKLGRTVFEITLRRNENKATLTDWKHRFEPLRCAYLGEADRWGTKYTPKDAVAALAPYAEAAQGLISLALQVKPALYHALSQSGLSREEAIKVVETFSSYVKKEGEV